MWLHFASAAVLVDRTSCFMWCVYCFFKVCAHISRWVVAQALQRTARWGSYCCGFLKQLSGTDASSWCHTNKSATHNVHLEARGSDRVLKNTTSPVLISCPVWQSSQTFLKSRIICIIFINFTLRNVRRAWPELPNAWGSWSGPYRWCQWTRQSLSPQSGLGEGQPLWAVGSIQSKTYLLPWRSYLSTASLWVRSVSSAKNYSIHKSSSKSNGVFL